MREELEPLLRQTVDHLVAARATELLEGALRHLQVQERSARVQCWKRAMRATPAVPFDWLRHKAKPAPIQLTTTTAGATANAQARLEAIQTVWRGSNQQGEPSLGAFMREYGQHLKRQVVDLRELQAVDLISFAKDTKPSASGLDGFLPDEIKILAHWCPELFTHLCCLLTLVETVGRWPSAAADGAVVFVPKDPSLPSPKLGITGQLPSFRPLIVCGLE